MGRWFCSVLLVLALAGCPAQAHHSVAGMFDGDQQVTVTGVIAEFQFVRPHPYLLLDADRGTTEPQRWYVEMDNHRELVRAGVTEDTFRAGDEVIVTGDHARDGTEQIYIRQLHRPVDGLRYEIVNSSPLISVDR